MPGVLFHLQQSVAKWDMKMLLYADCTLEL